jgi:hypothetical protein
MSLSEVDEIAITGHSKRAVPRKPRTASALRWESLDAGDTEDCRKGQ